MPASAERVRLYDKPLPKPYPAYVSNSIRTSQAAVNRDVRNDTSNDVQRVLQRPATIPQSIDGVFTTAVLSTTRLLAVFYWGRSLYLGKPLILLDFQVAPLLANSWVAMDDKLRNLLAVRRCRQGRCGCFIEGDHLAHAARGFIADAKNIPTHLTRSDQWHVMCQSAANYLAMNSVGYTREAADKMDERPFINAAGVYAGPRTEDPTVPAFLYGIVLGLDPVAARDPNSKPPVRSRR